MFVPQTRALYFIIQFPILMFLIYNIFRPMYFLQDFVESEGSSDENTPPMQKK